MEIKYVARNYKISDKFKDIIEKKLSKIEKYFDKDVEVKVNCIEQNERCKLELTINSSGLYLRSEVESDNMYNNIDTALPKLEKQIVKNTKKYKNKFAEKVSYDAFEFIDEAPKMESGKVVKTKTFDLDPISVEDAEAYMDAVGHNFYVFLNGETGEINVLYRRNDGNLGLIEVRK
ncbi:MAG: ribosome-associated translation inhibitor RaiA [Clostridia bacterium]|nr:ribosome-associated translation inhibitor RaiA [Clostridia bacterium]